MDENKKDLFVCMAIGLFAGFLFLSTAFVVDTLDMFFSILGFTGLVSSPLLFKKMGLLEEEF